MSNFKFKNIISMATNLPQTAKPDKIRTIFKNSQFVEGISQPKNILRTITSTRSNKEPIQSEAIEKPGIYAECKDPRCDICKRRYIENCTSFITSNKKIWGIRSHVTAKTYYTIWNVLCAMEMSPKAEKRKQNYEPVLITTYRIAKVETQPMCSIYTFTNVV